MLNHIVPKMVYGNAHRSLLRTIASQGVISFENCINIFKRLPVLSTMNRKFKDKKKYKRLKSVQCSVVLYVPDFASTSVETVINEINKEIKPFQQNIKIVIDELTSERKLVFLSLGYDDATKSQNVFSPKELDYFRILIENIMTTVNREIEISGALQLASKVNPVLKKTDAEVILKTWCTIHYLDRNNNCYALGVRAIHEFERYLQENMPDTIRNCSVCSKNVFRGVNCPACDDSIHTRCLNVHLEKVNKWPCCKVDFRNNRRETSNSSMLPETQLLQTQSCQGNSSSEAMDVSEIADETATQQSSLKPQQRRKRRRLSSD